MSGQTESSITVVGSLNLDLVANTERLPAPGETVLGQRFNTFVGGKGFNQAVAARRAGQLPVAMVGKLGQDGFGETIRAALNREGISGQGVTPCADPTISTGVAVILVDGQGQNSITVVPGANYQLTPAGVQSQADLIEPAKILLLQLEIPLASCQQAAAIARAANRQVILTVAPVPTAPLPPEFLAQVDILVLNEVEVGQLAALQTGQDQYEDELAAARALLHFGPAAVVVTLGERGAAWVSRELTELVSGFSVPVVDTTAAGDTFTGALAVALGQGQPVKTALRFANAAGALAVTKPGASTSIPTQAQIMGFLQAQGD